MKMTNSVVGDAHKSLKVWQNASRNTMLYLHFFIFIFSLNMCIFFFPGKSYIAIKNKTRSTKRELNNNIVVIGFILIFT